MKIQEAIDQIFRWHEPFVAHEGGRDKILCGDPDQECTGIAVTVCATYDVIKKAIEHGINLILTHESIFFGGQVSSAALQENDAYQAKRELIEEHHIVIVRDHDRMHGNGQPFFPERKRNDYIFYGICKELGWSEYVVGDKMKPLFYHIPETTCRALANLLVEKFGLNGIRIVGNMDAKITNVWFCEHVQGGKNDGEKIIMGVQADAIIPFEICDFTLTQYVNDAAAMGKNKILLEMGHFNCEELGMKYCLQWLPEALSEKLPLLFLPAGDLFDYIVR